MATVPSWAGQPCHAQIASIPVFGHTVNFEVHAANAMCRVITKLCTDDKTKARAKKVHSVGTCNCRQTTGGHSWSAHAWCGAVDIDPSTNPYSSSGKLITDFSADWFAIFRAGGFGCGADWHSVKDAMHFSIATNEGGHIAPETFNPLLATQAANAWKGLTGGTAPTPPPPPIAPGKPAPPWDPAWDAFVLDRPAMHNDHVKLWQTRMSTRGWTVVKDGYYGEKSYGLCMSFQREKRIAVDGIVGPKTWKASWEASVT